jgi:hypothetical protein
MIALSLEPHNSDQASPNRQNLVQLKHWIERLRCSCVDTRVELSSPRAQVIGICQVTVRGYPALDRITGSVSAIAAKIPAISASSPANNASGPPAWMLVNGAS